MSDKRDIIDCQIIDKKIFDVELAQKQVLDVDLKIVDVIRGTGSSGGASDLDDLSDVTVLTPSEKDILYYSQSEGKWINTSLVSLLSYFKVVESPTEVTTKIFRTSNAYVSGEIIVYINGIKEFYFTELNSTDIELEVAIAVDDVVEVEYIRQ